MTTRRDFLRRTTKPTRRHVMWLKETVQDGCTVYFPGKVDVTVYPHLKPYCRRVRKSDA